MVDVLRDMGHSPVDRKVSWEVGKRMRDQHVEIMGRPPEYALRRKTSGGGSHCLAVYAPHWRPAIEKLIIAFIRTDS